MTISGMTMRWTLMTRMKISEAFGVFEIMSSRVYWGFFCLCIIWSFVAIEIIFIRCVIFFAIKYDL